MNGVPYRINLSPIWSSAIFEKMKNWKIFFYGGLFAFFLWLTLAVWELYSPTVGYLPASLLVIFAFGGALSILIAGIDVVIRILKRKSQDSPSRVPDFLLYGVTSMIVFLLCVGVSGQLWRIQFYRMESQLSELAQQSEAPGFTPPTEPITINNEGSVIAYDPGPPVRFLVVILRGLGYSGTGYVYDPSEQLMKLMREPERQGSLGAPGTRTELNFGYALTGCEYIKPKWYRCTVDLTAE